MDQNVNPAPSSSVVGQPTPVSINALSEKAAEDVQASFASLLHEYLRANIDLAHQKALFVFGAEAVLIGFLYESIDSTGLGGLIATIPLLVSIALSLVAMTPFTGGDAGSALRNEKDHAAETHNEPSKFFWRDISGRPSSIAYAREIMGVSSSQLIEEQLKHSYDLAVICRHKFRIMSWSMWIGYFGMAMVVGLLATSYFG